MSNPSAQVDCTDLAAFMTRLGALRKADDSVIIELNDALPTQSFHPVNSRATCESVGKRLVEQQKERLALIQRCLEENERRAQTVPEGTFEARIVRNTIRQIRAEFEVEEIIGARTRKAVDERCGKIF
ncbi:hypothetical protein ANCCEY_07665 [Ancylostoma ceylanicum]|uniref:Protein MIX23 n=3 Tax=Ancylostoma TaxID=29169 RepID=A0A0D6LMB4_9BILA|nr:hypothetical protein ANCCEY_07665 [Ancylostoma ceylanicum]EYC45355.1 hypothetical protein Y032_0431g1328 [Ancylostoma ceylanicum]RCN53067.1 hypothetical protein ANCCAN_00616 [Ancylostoma caninum]